MIDLKQHKNALLITAGFALVYILISIVNHLNLRTAAYDLGLYNNAIYSYSHFKLNHSPLLQPFWPNRVQFADHLDLFLVIISPLQYLFGSYTLLIVQIFAVLFGGWGIYFWVKEFVGNEFKNIALAHFYTMWGIYGALSFDYHGNVIAAMFVPWIVLNIYRNNTLNAVIFTCLAISCKENISLYLTALFAGMFLIKDLRQKQFKQLFLFTTACLIYFVFAIKFAIPFFMNPGEQYIHFSYNALGKTFGEAIETIIKRPIYTFALLFEDPQPSELTFGIKSELHLFVLFTGGFAAYLYPPVLLPVLVILAQKLFNNDFTKWGIIGQYSIEFAPLLVLAFYGWLNQKQMNYKKYLALGVMIASGLLTVYSLDHPFGKWHVRERINFLDPKHYTSESETSIMIEKIKQIPSSLKVSAASPLTPHISQRDTIYMYPFIGNADIITLIEKPSDAYPLTIDSFERSVNTLYTDTNYILCYHRNNLLVFKQKDVDFCIKD